MKAHFKMTARLAQEARHDLARRHAFAHERVGFISARVSATEDELLILAYGYRPVADEDYLWNPSVGAQMGPDAIRKALQWALSGGGAIFHVHSHGGRGRPGFSPVDVRENAKVIPSFFQVAHEYPHGALVLSNDTAFGHIWLGEAGAQSISSYMEVGPSLRGWSEQ